MDLLDRARNGVEKPIFHEGKQVATVKQYNDAISVKLLLAHKELVALTRAMEGQINPEEVRASLDRKLADMREKLLNGRALTDERAKRSASGDDD